MTRLALLLAVACGASEPVVALPEPLPPAPVGHMVKAGPVEGYLVRPRTDDGPWPGVLLLPEVIDTDARSRAEEMAAGGRIVLVIGPQQDVGRAQRYLAAMPSTTTTQSVCQRAECP